MSFEFDPKKALANSRKHGIAFSEVEPVFYDDFALTREDADALGEARFVTVGGACCMLDTARCNCSVNFGKVSLAL